MKKNLSLRRKLIVAIVVIIIELPLAIGALPAWIVSHPPRRTVEQSGMADPTEFGFPAPQDVTFTSTDGLSLEGWLFAPTGPPNGAVIINGHYYANNRTSVLLRSRAFLEEGYHVLLFDFRNHGNSEGNLTSMGWQESADIVGAVTYLREEHGFEQIGLIGVSMSANAALFAAVEDPTISALALEGNGRIQLRDEFPPCDTIKSPLTPIFLAFFFVADAVIHGQPAPYNGPEALRLVAPRPVLVMHGAEGDNERCQHARMLAQGDHIEGWLVEGANHAGAYDAQPEEYAQRIIEFFAHHLLGETP